MSKVIIAGSRNILPPRGKMNKGEWMRIYGKRLRFTDGVIYKLLVEADIHPAEIVSGMARGMDRFGEAWARKRKITVKPFPADWEKYGKRAGAVRNIEMALYADVLVLVWDGKSAGSKMMKKMAKKEGLIILEFIYTEEILNKLE